MGNLVLFLYWCYLLHSFASLIKNSVISPPTKKKNHLLWHRVMIIFVAGDADQLEKAMEILLEMKSMGLCPNTITYSILCVASEK